ncbi:protein of unknown function [Xenorhabdus nematophila AN6/1]|nr:protein of unknown function [Xenorhabdus nematophila AN6/1]
MVSVFYAVLEAPTVTYFHTEYNWGADTPYKPINFTNGVNN